MRILLLCCCLWAIADYSYGLEQAESFRLAPGHFIPARMPMHLVYPRPDDETQAHARHRWAHPDMRYEIPVGVQGGAWPFQYELIEGPDGAVIGSVYGSDNYGTVSWQAPKSGTYQFTVQVTDQELNHITATWQVTVDEEQFVFIQDGWEGEQSGTLSLPLEDIADWYNNDHTDDSYHNKIIVFREGTYTLVGTPAHKNNLRLAANTKTPSLIAFPGENPVIDCSAAKVMTDNKSIKDLFIAGLTWKDGRQDVNNAHFFWAVGDVSRSCWWRNHFHNLGPGKAGNDNTLPVFVSGTGNLKEHILYKENLHTEINNKGKNGGYFEAYVSSYVLIEQNIARDSAVAAGWFPKGTVSHVSVRANEAYENVSGRQITVGYGGEARSVPHDHEVCWNRVRIADEKPATVFMWCASKYYKGKTYNSFIYRNTFVGGSSWVRFSGKTLFISEGNVVVTDMPGRWNQKIMQGAMDNLLGSTTDGVTDDEARLNGVYRERYLGTHGWEVE